MSRVLGESDVAPRGVGMREHACHAVRFFDFIQVGEPCVRSGLSQKTEQGVVLRQVMGSSIRPPSGNGKNDAQPPGCGSNRAVFETDESYSNSSMWNHSWLR